MRLHTIYMPSRVNLHRRMRKWPSSKAAANEEANRTLGYGEPLRFTTRGVTRVTRVNAAEPVRRPCLARTPLADVFRILLEEDLILNTYGIFNQGASHRIQRNGPRAGRQRCAPADGVPARTELRIAVGHHDLVVIGSVQKPVQ